MSTPLTLLRIPDFGFRSLSLFRNPQSEIRNSRVGLFLRGQAAIEFTVALAAVVLLFVGMVKVWTWMVNSVVQRQQAFESSRVIAATYDTHKAGQWGIDQPDYIPTCLSIFGEQNVGAQVNGACQ